MPNIKSKIRRLPKKPGIYQFFDKDGKLLYVGKSVSLRQRVASYFTGKPTGAKTKLLVEKTVDIKYIKVFSEFEALLLEARLIKKYQPFFNTIAKDDKSPLYIKIANDQIPLVMVTRREKPQRGVFLRGPFPSAKTTREILRLIRQIFPYCHHKNPKKPCLYVHLKLCPYPHGSDDALKSYLMNIKKIKRIVSGKSHTLVKELTHEMKNLADLEKFEEANNIKTQIAKLQLALATYHAPEEFLKQPTLVDDLTMQRLDALTQILDLKKNPGRIECYDVSNIRGKSATGSMIVFKNGYSAKDQYRRFRIKLTQKIDDYEMIREILTRRFKNNWPKPDLIIIDGGKGHLSAALTVLKSVSIDCKVVTIAKRYEEISLPEKAKPILLPQDHPARLMIQAIRDEAHRFAIAYHRLLRSKMLFE